jgi:hypothetical protein
VTLSRGTSGQDGLDGAHDPLVHDHAGLAHPLHHRSHQASLPPATAARMHRPRPPGKCAEGSAPAATGALTLVGLLSAAGVIGEVIAA